MYYNYIGDCIGLLIDDEKKEFTKIQTELIAKHSKLYTADEIRENICNNTDYPYGYGVLDANKEALKFVKSGTVTINKSVILSTDGLSSYLKNISNKDLLNLNADEIITQAKKTK